MVLERHMLQVQDILFKVSLSDMSITIFFLLLKSDIKRDTPPQPPGGADTDPHHCILGDD